MIGNCCICFEDKTEGIELPTADGNRVRVEKMDSRSEAAGASVLVDSGEGGLSVSSPSKGEATIFSHQEDHCTEHPHDKWQVSTYL